MGRAFAGAAAVFIMIPPEPAAPDQRAYQNTVSQACASAIVAAGVRRVVNLSSVGAQLSDGRGLSLGGRGEGRDDPLHQVTHHYYDPLNRRKGTLDACNGETGPHEECHEGSGEAYLIYDNCLSFRPRVVCREDQIGKYRHYLLRGYPYWADGNARQPSESCIYFTNQRGDHVWRLPQTMTTDSAAPEPAW